MTKPLHVPVLLDHVLKILCRNEKQVSLFIDDSSYKINIKYKY